MAKPIEPFEQLVERNYSKWSGIARSYASPSDQDDLLQEMMMKIWSALGSFNGDARIDTWAYRVALNTALMWNRKSKRRRKKLPRDGIETEHIVGGSSDCVESRILSDFMQSLGEVERALLLLYLDDMPAQEAAETLGISDANYRVRVHRLKKKYQKMFIGTGDAK